MPRLRSWIPDHVAHEGICSWFMAHHTSGWATCPFAENGMVRVLSQPAYPSGQRTPAEVIQILTALKAAFSDSYEFWPDDVSLTDNSLLDSTLIAGTRQVADIYLLGLAARHGGTLVSFDLSLAWQAVRGSSSKLVTHPGQG